MKYYNFSYILGDRFADGHGLTSSGYIKVNHSNEELEKAMDIFKQKTNCYWRVWGKDSKIISCEETKKIKEYIGKSFYNFDIEKDENNNEYLVLYPNSFIALLMTICRIELPDLDWCWNSITIDGKAFFNDMGYGLF